MSLLHDLIVSKLTGVSEAAAPDDSPIQTVAAQPDTIYEYGELEELEVTEVPDGKDITVIIFTSGDDPTVLTLPDSVNMPDSFEVDANKRYELNIMGGYGLSSEWPA